MSNLNLVNALNVKDVQIAINHYKVIRSLALKKRRGEILDFTKVSEDWKKYQYIRESNVTVSTVFHLLLKGKLDVEELDQQVKALYCIN